MISWIARERCQKYAHESKTSLRIKILERYRERLWFWFLEIIITCKFWKTMFLWFIIPIILDFYETKYYTEEKKHFSEISVRFPLEYFLFLYLYIRTYVRDDIRMLVHARGTDYIVFSFFIKVRKILENKNKIQQFFSEPRSSQQHLTMHIHRVIFINNFIKIYTPFM